MIKTLIIGLGNPYLTDDGAGIYTARAVQDALPPGAGIDVEEVSVGGLTLMEMMAGCQRVILIDALWTPAEETGQVRVFNAGDLPDTLNTRSAHDADLPTALRVGRALGIALPPDDAIHLVAITAHRVLEFGDAPTPPVAAAVPTARDAVLRLLGLPVPENRRS